MLSLIESSCEPLIVICIEGHVPLVDHLNQFLKGIHFFQHIQVLNDVQILDEYPLLGIKMHHRGRASEPLHTEPPQCHYQYACSGHGGNEAIGYAK